MGREVSEIKMDFSKAKLAANKAEAIAADIRQLADRDYGRHFESNPGSVVRKSR